MVIISKPARSDLKQIHEYISEDSVYYAHEVIREIIEQIKSIEKFPKKGRVVPEMQDRNIREIFVYSYRVVYRISEKIEVSAVIHAKRDFNEIIKNRSI